MINVKVALGEGCGQFTSGIQGRDGAGWACLVLK